MRFIIGIQPGCLPFPTGDSLFENASDRAAFVAIVRDPIQSLTSSERLVFFFLTVVAKQIIHQSITPSLPQHALGIDLEEGGQDIGLAT